jgi:hypothetical protein
MCNINADENLTRKKNDIRIFLYNVLFNNLEEANS